MDTVTDLLSTFFVSKNELVRHKTTQKADNKRSDSNQKSESKVKESKVDKETQVDKEAQEKVEEMPQKEPLQKLPAKRSSLEMLIDDLVGESDSSYSSDVEDSSSASESTGSLQSTDTTVGRAQRSESAVGRAHRSESAATPNETVIKLKKFILKAVEFAKRNMVIIGEDIDDSIGLLSDILHKLSLMKDVEKQYSKSVHVVTGENKKSFKKMILENPYLYFVDFDVKAKLKRETKKSIQREFEEKQKKAITIFDGVSNASVVGGAQTIILCKPNEDLGEIKEDKGVGEWEKALVIFKPGRYKMAHKQFFKNYVRSTGEFRDFDEYYKVVSNEDVDIRYLVVKNNQLRYI